MDILLMMLPAVRRPGVVSVVTGKGHCMMCLHLEHRWRKKELLENRPHEAFAQSWPGGKFYRN
jgi:hypothetical protein